MDNIKIREKLTEEEYELFIQNEDVEVGEDESTLQFNVDEFMGFTKCKIAVDSNLQITYEEAFIFGKDLPYKECTDNRMLRLMNHRLNLLFEAIEHGK